MTALPATAPKPVLRYPGSKSRIAPWIASLMGPHAAYLEPFFGSGTVLFAKSRAPSEIVNDLDGEVTNFFSVLRDQPAELARLVGLTPWSRDELACAEERAGLTPLEWARRTAVYWWQSVGPRGPRGNGLCVDYHGKVKPARSVTWM